MRTSAQSSLVLFLTGTLLLSCGGDQVVRPNVSLVSSGIQSIEVTQARLAIQKMQLIGATEDISTFEYKESFVVEVDLSGVITRLRSFSVPAGSYATVKVQVSKLDDPASQKSGRSMQIRGNVIVNGAAVPFTFSSDLNTTLFRRLEPPLVVPPNSGDLIQVVTLTLDRSKWFRDASGQFLDPRSAANQTQIEDNIKNSMRPYVGQLFKGVAAATTNDLGTPLVAIDEEGVQLGALVNADGFFEGSVSIAPSGETFTVLVGDDGLPNRVVSAGNVLLLANWTGHSVDMSVVAPDGAISVRRNVAVDPMLLAFFQTQASGNVLSQASSLRSTTVIASRPPSSTSSPSGVTIPKAPFQDLTFYEKAQMLGHVTWLGVCVYSGAIVTPAGRKICLSIAVQVLVEITAGFSPIAAQTISGIALVNSLIQCKNALTSPGLLTADVTLQCVLAAVKALNLANGTTAEIIKAHAQEISVASKTLSAAVIAVQNDLVTAIPLADLEPGMVMLSRKEPAAHQRIEAG